MFTIAQKAKLKAAGRVEGHPLFGKENPALDKVLDEIYLENPNAFLEDEDFKNRVFYHKPKDALNPKNQIQYAGSYPIHKTKARKLAFLNPYGYDKTILRESIAQPRRLLCKRNKYSEDYYATLCRNT